METKNSFSIDSLLSERQQLPHTKTTADLKSLADYRDYQTVALPPLFPPSLHNVPHLPGAAKPVDFSSLNNILQSCTYSNLPLSWGTTPTDLPFMNHELRSTWMRDPAAAMMNPMAWSHLINRLQFQKRKGGQNRFTNEQTVTLERKFNSQKYLSPNDRKKVAKKLQLSERQVKTWFQNRRAKWRRLRQDQKMTQNMSQHPTDSEKKNSSEQRDQRTSSMQTKQTELNHRADTQTEQTDRNYEDFKYFEEETSDSEELDILD